MTPKETREKYLLEVYTQSNGNRSTMVDMWSIGKMLGLDRMTTQTVKTYLEDEGFIESVALGGKISITHEGIKEAESY